MTSIFPEIIIFKEPESDPESDVDKDFEPSLDSPGSPVKTDFDSDETESDTDSE